MSSSSQAQADIDSLRELLRRYKTCEKLDSLPALSKMTLATQTSLPNHHPYALYLGTLHSHKVWICLGSQPRDSTIAPEMRLYQGEMDKAIKAIKQKEMDNAIMVEPFQTSWQTSKADVWLEGRRRKLKGLACWYFLQEAARKGEMFRVHESLRIQILRAMRKMPSVAGQTNSVGVRDGENDETVGEREIEVINNREEAWGQARQMTGRQTKEEALKRQSQQLEGEEGNESEKGKKEEEVPTRMEAKWDSENKAQHDAQDEEEDEPVLPPQRPLNKVPVSVYKDEEDRDEEPQNLHAFQKRPPAKQQIHQPSTSPPPTPEPTEKDEKMITKLKTGPLAWHSVAGRYTRLFDPNDDEPDSPIHSFNQPANPNPPSHRIPDIPPHISRPEPVPTAPSSIQHKDQYNSSPPVTSPSPLRKTSTKEDTVMATREDELFRDLKHLFDVERKLSADYESLKRKGEEIEREMCGVKRAVDAQRFRIKYFGLRMYRDGGEDE